VSRHVVFDESSFPFAAMSTTPSDPGVLDFLSDDDTVTLPIGPSAAPVGPLDVDAAPSSPHSGVAAPVDAPSQAVASSAAGGATTDDAAPGAAAHSA
jgi:hypothetical protein